MSAYYHLYSEKKIKAEVEKQWLSEERGEARPDIAFRNIVAKGMFAKEETEVVDEVMAYREQEFLGVDDLADEDEGDTPPEELQRRAKATKFQKLVLVDFSGVSKNSPLCSKGV